MCFGAQTGLWRTIDWARGGDGRDPRGPSKPKGSNMFKKLSDTQLLALSAAAQRDDRCLVPSPKLKGGALKAA